MDKTNKPAIIRQLVTHLVAAVAFCVLCVVLAKGKPLHPSLFVITFILAALTPIVDHLSTQRMHKARYFVTNTRVLAFTDGLKSVPFEAIHRAALRKDADGHTSLLLGDTAIKAKPHKWRINAASGVILADDVCDRFALYNVDDVDGLRKAIAGKFPLEG